MTPGANVLDLWFRSLTSGLAPERRRPHAVMLLTGYFDDSGSEGKGPVFVLAGYLSVMEVWEQSFSPAWSKALAAPPAIPYFKMREAWHLNDSFRGWSPAQRDKKVADLTAVLVHQPVLTALTLALSWDDFKRAQNNHPTLTEVVPYDMLFHGIMAHAIARMVKLNLAHQIEFVFDEQGKAGERAILTYRKIKSILPKSHSDLVVGSPRLADDKIVLPLQAADLLAWHVRRYWAQHGSFPLDVDANGVTHIRPVPENSTLNELIQNDSLWKVYDYTIIDGIFQAWTKPISEVSGA